MWPKWYRPKSYMGPKSSITISQIRDAARDEFQVSMSELKSSCRYSRIVRCRHAIAYIIKKKFPDASLKRIANCVGSKDHSTAYNGLKRANERINDPKDDFGDKIYRIMVKL